MAIDRETLRYLGWWLAFGVLMCLLPFVVGTGTLRILIFAHFLAMFAMSWDFLSGKNRLYQLRPSLPDRHCRLHDGDPELPLRRADLLQHPGGNRRDHGGRHAVLPAGTAHPRHLFRAGDARIHGDPLPAHKGGGAQDHRRNAGHFRPREPSSPAPSTTTTSASASCSRSGWCSGCSSARASALH